MARQIMPIVGGVVGFMVGGPVGAQVGFALGSMIGNAIDPVTMQGNKVGDAPTQVAAEGGARAIVFGKGCIRATCIIERGGRRVIKQRDSAGGKGSGPTTESERALWTYAIGLGEALVDGAILRIWEDEKLVYDVTPDSTIVSDSAKFAQKFRFHDGNEAQLPDPAIEAIYTDPEDAPYYRGTAYMVFPQRDLTDWGERVPTYRVEVATAVSSSGNPVLAYGLMDPAGGLRRVGLSPDGLDWSAALKLAAGDDFSAAAFYDAVGDRYIAWGLNYAFYSDDDGDSWIESSSSLGGSGGIRAGDVSGDNVTIAGGINDAVRSDDAGTSYASWLGSNGLTHLVYDGSAIAGYYGPLARAYRYDASWAGPFDTDVFALNGHRALATDGALFRLVGKTSLGDPVCKRSTNMETWSTDSIPFATSAEPVCICSGVVGGDEYWVVGTDDGHIYFKKNADAWAQAADSLGTRAWDVVFNGRVFVMCGGEPSGASDGVIKTSEDGNTWTTRPNLFEQYVRMLATREVSSSTEIAAQVQLSVIVAAIHDRCGHTSSDYAVAQLTDMLSGVVIEQTLTGAEAINSIIGGYFADPSDYDGKIHYIKRGSAAVRTLTLDDLTDEPEDIQRQNAIEYPRKFHLFAQLADQAYAPIKATSARYSEDIMVVGEASSTIPVTFDSGTEPYEIAAKMHKVLWAEAVGEITLNTTDSHADLVPTDCIGFSYRGQLSRLRITKIEDTPSVRKITAKNDRQSAYTANLTAIPTPPAPTTPQPSTPADTILAVLDTSALTDDADTLHKLVAMSGSSDAWAGATVQRSNDGGASFVSEGSTALNAIMGVLQDEVTSASPYYTDTTNVVRVQLYTSDDLNAQTDTQFLNYGGAFALSYGGSGGKEWELMQYRDAVEVAPGLWELSHLMRGRKYTEAAEHSVGELFVFIDPSILRIGTQSAWSGTELVHRGVSHGQSPEEAVEQSMTYAGNSQREWPVAELVPTRLDANTITAEVVPRNRFGTPMNPVRSVNWTGYRWTVYDGVNTINRDGTSDDESFDVTGWTPPIFVTVSQLNRFTGAGDSVTEEVE